MSKSYYIPAKLVQVETEVKKSRFIARVDTVKSREQAMNFLGKAKNDYPDARHHCWAYLIGNPQSASNAAMNDDGEPAGTAGKPILNVIQHKCIGDVMVVVIRYFGGTKLGAGGLTRAYSGATEAALSQAPLEEKIPMIKIRLGCGFFQEQTLRHWVIQWKAEVESTDYSEQVSMILDVPKSNMSEIEKFCLANNISVDEVGI